MNRSREFSAEDDFASQAAWRMAQARVLSHRGEHDEALRLADEAVGINEATDYLTWQAESDEVRGMVLAAAGRMEEAQEAYDRALERFERKGVVPAVGAFEVGSPRSWENDVVAIPSTMLALGTKAPDFGSRTS